MCYEEKMPNPLFVNIGNRTPRALFGGRETAGVIDTEGGIIIITKSIFKSPRKQIEARFLPGGDKPVKLAFSNSFVIALGMSGRVYESEISSANKFKIVEELSQSKVVDISGAFCFCFALLDDGRVFGRGNNYKCRLGLPKETKSVSKFTLIESLNKYKIVSVFAGSCHSIFKTIENKMIVCGDNFYGQLFIPLEDKKIVYPPEEVPKCQGFTFCFAGSSVSAAFFDVEAPPNFSDQKTIEKIAVKEEMIKENEEIKKNLLKRKEEVLILKEINSKLEMINKENEIRLKKTEEEKSKLETKNKENEIRLKKTEEEKSKLETRNKENEIRLKKTEEEKSKLETINKENEIRLGKTEEENSELKEKIKKMKEEKIERKEQVKQNPLLLGSNEMKSYKKGKTIECGATSIVYEATHEIKLAMKEMLKIKQNDDSDDDEKQEIDFEQAKRFLQESEILNSLEDEHIVKTYGFFLGDKKSPPAIILEYCESNLKKEIKQLTNKEQILIIIDIVSAMKKVHSKGIIHRNLKLENILLDANNRAKLSDFGLCTFIGDDEILSHTSMVGSMEYMSPELLQGRTDYDEKVDVYAFGVVLFLILTKGVYPNINFVSVASGKQAQIPKSITEFSSQLIKDCWSFKPSDRPSFAEIRDRLKGNEQKLIEN